MGVYLITIAVKDVIWSGQYYLHDYEWRSSLSCQITGAISLLSSEVSVMLISLISADRFKNIVFPFRSSGLTHKMTHGLCFTIWMIGYIIAFLPMFGIHYFEDPASGHHYYGRSVVCLPLQLSSDKPAGWEYSVAVFVGLNLAFFIFVMVAYLVIFINRSLVKSKSANTKRETALAKRVFFIILTDCACWMPVIVLGIRSIVEKSFQTPGDLTVWIAVFALPINSAINPILYTLSTPQVRGVLREKWQQMWGYLMKNCSRVRHKEGTCKKEADHGQVLEMQVSGSREEKQEQQGQEEIAGGESKDQQAEHEQHGKPNNENKVSKQLHEGHVEHRHLHVEDTASAEHGQPHTRDADSAEHGQPHIEHVESAGCGQPHTELAGSEKDGQPHTERAESPEQGQAHTEHEDQVKEDDNNGDDQVSSELIQVFPVSALATDKNLDEDTDMVYDTAL